MTLLYILSGILLLGALSYLGIRRERNERLRFEREEMARLEGANGADNPTLAIGDPEPLSIWDPSSEGAGISVHLGSNGRDPLLWRPLELPNPHLLIVGGSGSGKSQTLKAIAHELREACAVVVLDLHGDLDVEGFATHELHFRSRYGINPLVLSLDQKGGGPNAQREIVRTRLQRTFAPMESLQLGTLDGLLRQCYEARGIRQEDPTSWYREPPSFADMEALLKREISSTKRPEKLEALRTKISPVFDCQIFSRPALPIAEKGITRIDMSRLSSEVQFLASDILLRHLFREAMLAGEASPGKLRTMLVIDEAKLLALRGKGDPLGVLNRLATEARKYGLGLLLASQDLEHFTRDILTNVAAKLVLMHAETAIRTTAGRLLLEKGQLQALRELAAAIVTSLRGEGVLLILDSLNRIKPTDQAWLEEFINNSVCLIATRDRDEKNLKPLLLRFQLIEVPPLKKREAYELMEALLAEKPVPSVDPAFFQRSVWEASRGYPSAIRDLIWKGSLEKYVDREQIRAIHHEAGVKGFSIAPLVVILTAALAIWRYVARGVGDQDRLIIGGAGVVVFMVIQFFMRKAR